MVLEFTQRPIDGLSFNESSELKVDIPRDNPIQSLICEVFVEMVNGTSPVETDDGLLEIIKSAKLQMDGKDIKFNKTGRQWFYIEKDDKRTSPYRTTFVTTNSATHTEKVLLIHDFVADPLDENDISALLPANRMSSLKFIVNFGVAADVSSNIASITDANSGVNIEIIEVTGTVERDGSMLNIGDVPFADIREDARVDTLLSAKTSFDTSTMKVDVTPAPANIIKTVMIQLDNDIRTNALITDVKLQKEKGGTKRLRHFKWNSEWARRKVRSHLESPSVGVLVLDHVDFFKTGLINRGNEGDIRFRILTASTNEAQDTLEMLQRYISLEGN